MRSRWALAAIPAIAGACAAPATAIVEPRELAEASGAARLTEVVDLGGMDVPAVGALRPPASDGVAVIGEALWIRGSGLGRQPTVSVGGRAAAVLSRTGDGGILVRVPVGTPAGPQPIIVGQEGGDGEATRTLTIRRLGAVLAPPSGQVVWLDLSGDQPAVLGTTAVPGARLMALSPDGRAGYVVDAQGRLTVLELPAAGGPRICGQLDPGVRAPVALTAAQSAHRLVVVGDRDAVVIDTSAPLRPRIVGTRPLSPAARAGHPTRAAVSPDGERLAVALADPSRVLVLALSGRGAADGPAAFELGPEAQAGRVVALAFAPDGRTLWALAGDTEATRALGPQPTTVHAIRLGGSGGLERARVVTLAGVQGPLALSTGRSLPLASGSAIRLPPERATVYLAAGAGGDAKPAVYALGAEDTPRALPWPGAGAIRLGGLDVTPDGRWVLGAAVQRDSGLQLIMLPASGRAGGAPGLGLGLTGTGPGDGAPAVLVQP